MIDWVTCKIPFPHPPIASGMLVSLNHEGEVEWVTAKRYQVPGSHSATITVKSEGSLSDDRAEFLSISGNPSKFLQGHNVFGSDDLLALVSDTLQRIDKALQLRIDPFTFARVRHGDYQVATLDINYSFYLENQNDVMAWIHAAEFKSRTRSGRPATRPGTIYWQKHSRRWALKAYSKFNELTRGGKDHALSSELGEDVKAELLKWCENILRIELRLKSLELRALGLTRAADLQTQISELFAQYQEKIIMNDQRRISDRKLMELPNKLRSTYTLWAEGHHMVEMLPRATFYRHRKELLDHGIDISITVDSEERASNVVPFMRVLEAKPAPVPQWAFEKNMVHQSAANMR